MLLNESGTPESLLNPIAQYHTQKTSNEQSQLKISEFNS